MKQLIALIFCIGITLISSAQCNPDAPVTHYLSQTQPGQIYRPSPIPYKGGDTIRITLTAYSGGIEFFNLAGDECRPIVIIPSTKLTTPFFRLTGNSRYIKVLGGDSLYGIKINGAFAISKANHIYAENIECYGGSIGIFARLDADTADYQTFYPNYLMNKIIFNKFYVHDVAGEGTYIGHTSDGKTVVSPYSGLDTFVTHVRLDSVQVTNSVFLRCGWDGLQVANCKDGLVLSGNTIMDVGLQNESAQKAGILMGTNCSGDIFNNVVRRAAGNGIQIFGYGNIKVYNNVVDSCGFSNELPNGEESIYGVDYQYVYEGSSLPYQNVEIYNNYINKPQPIGAIRFYEINNRSGVMNLHDNRFCIPDALPNWQTTNFKFPNAFINSNNILYCEQPCNCIITNILRGRKYIN